MEIRKLKKSDIPAAKQLWMDAFGDSEAFVRFYFENKFDLKKSLGAFEGGTLVGDLTMQNMTVRLRDAFFGTGFLAGCATRQVCRNQGVMRNLLFAQMSEMNKAGYTFCHLHPFLHAFYRKFGWETVSFMKEVVARADRHETVLLENDFDLDALWKMYCEFMACADGGFLRSREEMRIRIEEHLNDGGKIIACDGGYALYFADDHELQVIELVWTQQSIEKLLLLLKMYGVPVHFFLPDYLSGEMKGDPVEYTMMRIVNVERLFENLKLNVDSFFTLRVYDDFCEWNNKKLFLDFRKGKKRLKIYTGNEIDAETDIRDLARLVAGKTKEDSGPLRQIFPPQKTCFFNTY